MDAMSKKRSGSAKKENKQCGSKKKAKSPARVSSKAISQQEKNEADEEREEKKKEKMQKKKALDERDFNVLGQMSQLTRSIVMVNEHDRDVEEKEMELARKKADLERREKEVKRKEGGDADNVLEVNKNAMRTRDMSEIAGPSWRNVEEDDEDSDEYLDFDDSGVMECYTKDIDVLEASNIIKTPERPTTGKKRPRANPLTVGTTAKKCPRKQVVEPECAQCRHLLLENKELREANARLTEELNAQRMEVQPSDAPRPGKISKEVAERYKMIELSPGRCIYIYDGHLTKAYTKKTATATACFLLSCFYRDDELVGRSLAGKNGKPCVDTDILESILSYTRKKFPDMTSDSGVKIALRNKITCLEAKLKKRTIQVVD
ncbi:DNA ligase 1-like [Montipora foliosa]|uniref:DNA ligase 1-like n=1 Tax=Montipora foliosa TaxID=591990 RepID=UPI0035F12E70